jgi:tetratricopeptide (TPR) repeat protein
VTSALCPSDDALSRLVAQTITTGERDVIAVHAADCDQCRDVVVALLDASADGATTIALGAPERVGRYVIERRLGAGGMGVVFAAHDPELGRRVAIKLLRRGPDARLRHEAKALAKLSHPNVVAVHDVGSHRGSTFIAMALVDGVDLRTYLIQRRRTTEIVRVLVAAARGVIAAHAAGLVHRDLKPDNIFVGSDGGVQVGDFGLARGHGDRDPDDDRKVSGTPAYMAPEQLRDDAVPASDQFSFCVTAWEALYGVRPFDRTGLDALDDPDKACAIREPPGDRGVPRRIEAALRRGMAFDPAARFRSMEALVDAIAPRRRTWPWIAGAAVLGAVAAGVAVLATRGAADPCADTARMLDATWSDARRAQIAAAFEKLDGEPVRRAGRRGPEASLMGGAVAAFDRHAKVWLALRRDACLATRVRGERPVAQLERTARCLDRQAAVLRATLDAIASGTTTGRDARALLDGLDPVERCREAAGSLGAVAASADGETVRTELAMLELRSTVLDTLLVGTDLDAVAARAAATGDAVAIGAVTILRARRAIASGAYRDAEAALRDAIRRADTAGDDIGRARAHVVLVHVLLRTGRAAEAAAAVDAADGAVARVGGDDQIAIEIDDARAAVAHARGEHDAAIAIRNRIVERELRFGASAMRMLNAYFALGNAYSAAGRPADAVAAHRKAEAIAIELGMGADPVEEGARLHARAMAQHEAGDIEGAVATASRIVALNRVHAPGTAAEASAVLGLADSIDATADAHAAAIAFDDFAAITDALPAEQRNLHNVLDGLLAAGRNYLRVDRPIDAEARYRRAIEVAAGFDDDRIVLARAGLGRALEASDRETDAISLLEGALAELGPERLGARAGASIALARALWSTGGKRERARARVLADDAVTAYGAILEQMRGRPGLAPVVPDVERDLAAASMWRDTHR